MSNALLAMSGPTFGNMDVTVYDVYTVASSTIVTSTSNAVTIFSGRSWSWALVDIMQGGAVTPRPFAVSNSVSINGSLFSLNMLSGTRSCFVHLYGTSTNLTGGVNNNGSGYSWIITAYVPST